MVDKRLLTYFEEGVKMGNSLDDLKESLLALGWDEDEIDEARSIFVLKMKRGKESNVKKVKKPRRIVLLFSACILLAVWWLVSFVYSSFSFEGESAFLVNWLIGMIIFLLLVFIGIGILKGKKSSRIVGIIVFSFFVIVGILGSLNFNWINFFNLFFSLFVLIELIFDKKVKRFLK